MVIFLLTYKSIHGVPKPEFTSAPKSTYSICMQHGLSNLAYAIYQKRTIAKHFAVFQVLFEIFVTPFGAWAKTLLNNWQCTPFKTRTFNQVNSCRSHFLFFFFFSSLASSAERGCASANRELGQTLFNKYPLFFNDKLSQLEDMLQSAEHDSDI